MLFLPSSSPILSRRAALAGLAGTGLGLAAAGPVRAAAAQAVAMPAGACLLTPQAVEGPFYLDPKLERRDVTEGLPGVPLRLALQVLEAADCTPVAGARVDLWHADAAGRYSGYDGQGDGRDVSTKGQTFLRGAQVTDGAGRVDFATLYPGWYRGRTTHIHFKVWLGTRSVLTGQIYFPDALSEFLYREVAPYNTRSGPRDTTNAADGVLRGSGGSHASFCAIREEADHYAASLVIGIDRAAAPAADAMGGPPPGPRPPMPPPGGFGRSDAAPLTAKDLVPFARE